MTGIYAGHQLAVSKCSPCQRFSQLQLLTSCRMVSVRTRCQSTMMLSVSYCIRNSTAFLVFNWGGDKETHFIKHVDKNWVWVQKRWLPSWIGSLIRPQTSKTFFLLDLSFVAQQIVAPFRSTVNSGTIWLVLFCMKTIKKTQCLDSTKQREL